MPAFTGLGAPYWNSKSRGLITGLTRDSDWRDLVRATIESVAYQTSDLFLSMRKDGLNLKVLRLMVVWFQIIGLFNFYQKF